MRTFANKIAASLAARRLHRAEQIQAAFEDRRRRNTRPAPIHVQYA